MLSLWVNRPVVPFYHIVGFAMVFALVLVIHLRYQARKTQYVLCTYVHCVWAPRHLLQLQLLVSAPSAVCAVKGMKQENLLCEGERTPHTHTHTSHYTAPEYLSIKYLYLSIYLSEL